jgi:hypothetical protein
MTAQDEKLVTPLINGKDEPGLRKVVGGAWEAIIGRAIPAADEVSFELGKKEERSGYIFMDGFTSYKPKAASEKISATFLYPNKWNGNAVLWLSLKGPETILANGAPTAAAQKLLDAGFAIACPTLYLHDATTAPKAGDNLNAKPGDFREFSGYTYGYNPTLLSRRVHDVMTMVTMMESHPNKPAKKIFIAGTNGAGPIAAAAGAMLHNKISAFALDLEGFRFDKLTSPWDPNFVPGAVKYGDVPALLKLCSPAKVTEASGTDAVAAVFTR